MQITVTGAGGFIGRRLIQNLLLDQSLSISKIIATDLALSNMPDDPRLERVEADLSDPLTLSRIVTPQTTAVFHLAAIVSVGAEEDFELGMRVNFDATRALLDACRKSAPAAKFLFASTAAVYGGELEPLVGDNVAPVPQTSYGTQKVMCELLINDYSRRGFVDGRSLRLPTVVVRPGRPNKAASTFASSIIREPLQGSEAVCPVTPDTAMSLISPRKVVEAFVRALSLPAEKLGFSRVIQLPGFTATIAEMLAALEEVAGENVARRVRFVADARIQKIVSGWPMGFRAEKGLRLGFSPDSGMREVIRAFIADDLNGTFVA